MEREFKNRKEVAAFLKKEGWKVSQSTFYEHSKIGMIWPDVEKKRYSLKAVLKYAKTHLVPMGTMQKKKDEDLQRKKIEAEIEWKQEQARREKIKRQKEEGELIERDRIYLELASRAAVLEAGLKGMIQIRAGEFVALVGGDEQKAAELVREITAEVDLVMNEFATMKEFEVVFKG
jgi:hypothetical protein